MYWPGLACSSGRASSRWARGPGIKTGLPRVPASTGDFPGEGQPRFLRQPLVKAVRCGYPISNPGCYPQPTGSLFWHTWLPMPICEIIFWHTWLPMPNCEVIFLGRWGEGGEERRQGAERQHKLWMYMYLEGCSRWHSCIRLCWMGIAARCSVHRRKVFFVYFM